MNFSFEFLKAFLTIWEVDKLQLIFLFQLIFVFLLF